MRENCDQAFLLEFDLIFLMRFLNRKPEIRTLFQLYPGQSDFVNISSPQPIPSYPWNSDGFHQSQDFNSLSGAFNTFYQG